MKKPKMPKVCDTCMEDEELHWSEDEGMWICDLCEEAIHEDRAMNDYWLEESYKHMEEEE